MFLSWGQLFSKGWEGYTSWVKFRDLGEGQNLNQHLVNVLIGKIFFLRCSKLHYSGHEWEKEKRQNCLLMAVGQQTKDFFHSCFAYWNFGFISSWLFPEMILARQPLTPGASACLLAGFAHYYPQPICRNGHCFMRNCYPPTGTFHLLPSLCL